LAVLTEAYWPGYSHAEINGVPTSVVRVNHAFQAVVIGSPGDYRITFTYEPPNYAMARMISGLGLVLLAAATYALWLSNRPPIPA
jgi:uncharacterized membrane protein YfhO